MARKIKQADPVDLVKFDSVSAAMEAFKQPMQRVENTRVFRDSVSNQRGSSWFGAPSIEAVHAAMREGYPEGLKLIDENSAKITGTIPKALGVNRARKRGSMGDELDIHAVNRGSVDRAWSTQSRAIKRTNNFIRLVIDIGGSSGTSAEQLAWRGVAGMVLAEVLGKAGYSVEIVAAFGIRRHVEKDSSKQMLFTTVIKSSRALADRGLLASVLTMPGFFRVYGFHAIVKNADDAGKECVSNLGHSASVETLLPADPRAIQIIIPQSVESEKAAIEWVNQNVALLQMATIQREGR